MNYLSKLSLFLLVTLLATRPALAKEHGGGELREALKSLNLTDEQRTKIKELRKSGAESHKETRKSLKEGRKALQEAMKSDAKKADLIAKFDALQGLRNKMGRARFEMMLDVREILTPEQRQKFRSFMESHKGRRFDKEAEQD